VLDDVEVLPAQLGACLRDADGLDLGRLRIASPFASRLHYNLSSRLRVIPAHQRQHSRQAEQVIRRLRPAGGGR
jgi:hypothetical protein